MNRPLIITATTILTLLSGVTAAQQDRPGGSGTSGSSASGSGASGSGSGASGSGTSGSGTSGSGASGSGTSGSDTSGSGASGSGASGSGASGAASPPVAGKAVLGVTVVEMDAVIRGWSAEKDLLDKTVTNDQKEKIGKIEDLIVSRSTDAKLPVASFAIIGVGGFLGIGKQDVAIPMEQIKLEGKQLVLTGATKAALKALPPFEYARK